MHKLSHQCYLIPLLAAACCSAQAVETLAVGPRGQAMAGANVASVNDATAQYYNPGALGFFRGSITEGDEASENDNHHLKHRDFDLTVDAGAGYRASSQIDDFLENLSAIDITSLSALTNGDTISAQQLDDIVTAVGLFTKLANENNNIVIQTTAGANIRIKNFAIGARGFGNFLARVDSIDLTNMGFDFGTVGDFETAMSLAGQDSSIVPTGYTSQYINSGDITGITDTDAIRAIDYQIDQGIQAGLFTVDDVSNIVNLMSTVANAGPGGSFDSNTTSVLISGIGYVEVPLSYGHAFNDNLSVGISVKAMIGRLYGVDFNVFSDEADNVLDNLTDEFQESETFGIDLGVMGRINNFQIGLNGRNLNSPTFKGFTNSRGYVFKDIKLDPQVTLGVAWIPSKTMTLEVDIDVTAPDSGFSDYKTQNIAIGAEWLVGNFLALRAGSYINLAESDIGPVLTAGVGLNFAIISIDLAIAASTETATFEGEELPEELAFNFGITGKF